MSTNNKKKSTLFNLKKELENNEAQLEDINQEKKINY